MNKSPHSRTLLMPMIRLLAILCCLTLTPGFADAAALIFYADEGGGVVGVPRPGANNPISALTALASPPDAAEAGRQLESGLPPGTEVLGLQTKGDHTTVEFSLAVTNGLDEAGLTMIFEQVRATLRQFNLDGSIRMQAGGRLLSSYLPPVQPVEPGPKALTISPKAAGSALAGRNITVGPSHGRFWNGSGWYWQRSDPCGFGEAVLEDCNSIRLVQFLNQYLTQDGATVHVPRELNESNCCNTYEGQPWWKMAAYSWLRANSIPCSVWASSSGNCGAETAVNRNSDDIRARPLYADYRGSDIYIAHHTNAGGGGTANGTETFRDTAMEHPAHETASYNLAMAVNKNVVNTIREMYDANWSNRGVKDSAGGFGEIRIPNRPAILIELGFHDNCTRDALYLKDNFFRSLAEWGLYKGICEYFGTTPTWDKYSDEYVSDTIPRTMNPGQSYNVSVTFRNRGVVWSEARTFRLGAVGESDPFTATTRRTISGEVRPGDTYTFSFTMTAPATPGTYLSDWRMVRDGIGWFGAALNANIVVGQAGETGQPATWGPYNLTAARSIYAPANQAASLRTGWYTTTAGTGAARSVLKADDSSMATMPDAAIASGATFTAAFTQSGTYSTLADNPLNIFRVSQPWDAETVLWNVPWGAGGSYTPVGTSSQSVVFPAEGALYTFSVGAGYNFPYGVMMKGDVESSISYRKAWLGSGPYPTLSVGYTTPPGTTNAVIRSWAYLGWYNQGAPADRQLRIDTDQVAGTYGGVPVTEASMAPKVGGPGYGNSYGVRQWAQGTSTNDLVDLNSASFYNGVHENVATYCSVYVYNSKGSSIPGAYLGIGSDDGCKVWWNGAVVGSDVVARAVAADSDFWGPVTINNGWNRLLVKVENGTTGHGLYARFANANRTALTDKSFLAFRTTDATAPAAPAGLAVAGVASGVWQNAVAAPVFAWTSGADSPVGGEGVSGVRGQKYYFGADPEANPNTFQTGTSYAPGAQASGTYYFKASTIDYALNESSATTFAFWYDITPPTGVSLGLGAITLDSIAVTGAGMDAHSGVNPSTGYNYSRSDVSDSGPKGATHTWTGLAANTEYTGLAVTVSDQTAPTANTSVSPAQSAWTLSAPPVAGSITPDHASITYGRTNRWTAVNGFGAGQVQYYRYAFDQSPTHAWTESEPQWSGGTLATVPASAGVWYLHVKGYNGADLGNGAFDYAVTATPPLVSATTLVSSLNPSVEGSNVTFTATVSPVSPATNTPTGEVVFLANSVPFSTNGLIDGVAAASTASLAVGTNDVAAQYAGDGDFLGSADSLWQVVPAGEVVYSQTNIVSAIVDNRDGTFTLSFVGTPQARYYVVTHPDLAPLGGWTALPGSTNTAPAPNGLWSVTVTNTDARRFYRSAAVNPAP